MSTGRRWVALAGVALLSACGDGGTSPFSGSIVGSWELVTVNGAPVPQGTLRWTFTQTTITSRSDFDCDQTASYVLSGSTMTVTVTQQSGTECGDVVGDVFESFSKHPKDVQRREELEKTSTPQAGAGKATGDRAP